MFRDIPIIHDLSKVMARVRIARAWLAQLSVHTAASQPFETLRPRPPVCTRPARGRACARKLLRAPLRAPKERLSKCETPGSLISQFEISVVDIRSLGLLCHAVSHQY